MAEGTQSVANSIGDLPAGWRLPLPGDASVSPDFRAVEAVAAGMTAMDIAIRMTFRPHDDPDASLAFYRDRPEVVPVVLLLLQAGPG